MNTFNVIILILSFNSVRVYSNQSWLNQTTSLYRICSKICQECSSLSIKCQNQNLTDLKLISNSMVNTERIVFTGNSILSIKKQIFFDQRPNLKYIDLSENNLTLIDKNSFNNLSNLEQLILDKNSLNFTINDNILFLNTISGSLKHLSLRQNLKPHSGMELFFLNGFSDKINLFNLKELNLEQNYLSKFDQSIFCNIPKLFELNLQSNNLSKIDLNLNCINSLNLLNLKSNRFQNIDTNLIEKFNRLKQYQPNFEVYLNDNPFKCDCNLYEFFKFLMEKNALGQMHQIIKDIPSLKCSHPDSLHYSLNKPIINSNLDNICGYPKITTKQFSIKTNSNSSMFTNRAQTVPSKKPYETHHDVTRFVVFLFCSMLMSACLILVLKLRLQKLLHIVQFKFYKKLDNEANPADFGRLSFDGAISQQNKMRQTRKNKSWFRSIINKFRRKDANINYCRFDYQSSDSNRIYKLEKRKSDSPRSFSLTKLMLNTKKEDTNHEMDILPIVCDEEESVKNITTGLGVLGVRNV